MSRGAPDGEPLAGSSAESGWLSGRFVPASAIRELAARATAVDGVAAMSGHVLDAIGAGAAHTAVHVTGAGAIVGAAVAVGADPAEVVVDPAIRRRGHGAALVSSALDRQGGVWAYGDLPAAAGLARRLDLVRGRVLLQMRRSVDPTAQSPAAATAGALPDGVRLRTFIPGQDEQAFLAVNARAFAWHPEQGRLDLAGLQAEMSQSWFDPAGFFLAVTQDRVVGFHWTKIHPQDPNPGSMGRQGPIGEVYVLGVDPESGLRGLGAPLTAVGLEYLSGRGLDSVMLYVEGDNDRALRLYERFGFRTFLTNAVYARPAAAK